jgi:hypothetical protein
MTNTYEAKLTNETVMSYILGGNATITIKSLVTGVHFTYNVRTSNDNNGTYFVSLLNGSDNENNYAYMGIIRGNVFASAGKVKVHRNAPSVIAFMWVFERIMSKSLTEKVEVWHSGKCGRCGRKLTVVESISSGFGPECITKVGM